MRMRTATVDRIRPPSVLLALAEMQRAMLELSTLPAAAPILSLAPKGDGHPVLVLPGFTATDRSTAVLRRYLDELGYRTFSWDLGRNLGPRSIGREGEHLLARLKAIHDSTGQKVSIVGWSLGGIMARQLSRWAPDAVRQVISLGSPFAGDPSATNVGGLYQALTGQSIDDPDVRKQLRESELPPPVPATAIYSRTDGIVAWQNCIEPEAATSETIEVYGSHCGLGVNPAVLFAVADRLALPEEQWAPFDRSGWRAVFYPRRR